MLTGFNTNVPYKNGTYHVQTEDGGTRNPVLTTLLYHKGAILVSEKTSYADLLVDDDWKDKVIERMKDQHRSVIKKLMAGHYTGDAEAEEEAGIGDEGQKSLEDTLLEYIIDEV
jgi:hypothetical protein